jgi:hypothetical protein
MAGLIAAVLAATLGLTVVGIVGLVWVGRLPAEALTQGVFPTMMGLTGMTLGFCLSSRA